MGLLRKLLGTPPPAPPRVPDGRPDWLKDGITVSLYDGNTGLSVVGESFYQGNLWRLAGASRGDEVRLDVHAILVPEDNNPYDPNAISVWVSGLKAGHLSRDDAVRYRPGLLDLMRRTGKPVALSGVIVGGGDRRGGPGMLGIFLSHDPTDFGLPPEVPHHHGDTLTGFSAPQIRQSWAVSLPADPIKRIPRLRILLGSQTDPVERHFIFSALEDDLYRSRDAFPSSLTEFDEVCERHHAELVSTIRQALLAEFSGLPVIEMYRQACIRHQKLHAWDSALTWGERGLTLYGEDALRPEAVDDLRKRAATYRDKLGRRP